MAGGSAFGEAPWSSLLHSCAGEGRFVVAFPRRTAVALAVAVATVLTTLAIAETAAVTITKAETPIVALAVAVNLTHHRGGAVLVLVHPNCDVAQHFLAEPLLSLDLLEGGRRRIDIEQGEMRLAVLAQTVGEGLHAPLLGLGDLATHLFDDGLELGGQCFDLLRAGVLAREEDVFVEWHPMPFPCSLLPRREALRALSGKARMLRRREHGTPDHRPCRSALTKQPSVQFPAGIERKRGLYGVPTKRQGGSWPRRARGQPSARLDRANVAVS